MAFTNTRKTNLMLTRTQLILWIALILILLLEIPLVAALIFDQFSVSDIFAALSAAGLLMSVTL